MNLKHNAKLYSLIFLLAFLAVQVSLVLHTVEHGVLDHTHAGKQCEQYVFAKHYNADTPSAAAVNVYFTEYKISYDTGTQIVVTADILDSNLARAPPFYS